jgi:hypothetical protein
VGAEPGTEGARPQCGRAQVESSNPKVMGWDGAVRSFVDYLHELSTIA